MAQMADLLLPFEDRDCALVLVLPAAAAAQQGQGQGQGQEQDQEQLAHCNKRLRTEEPQGPAGDEAEERRVSLPACSAGVAV